jgi:glutamyl/glutaminyl-tRNA synthetase
MKLKLVLLLFSSFIISCSGKLKSHRAEKPASAVDIRRIVDQQNLESKIANLQKSMIDYMNTANPSYTEKDVKLCVDILNKYLINMAETNSKEQGMQTVASTVSQLNDLNEDCDAELIETGERERIAEIIILAGSQKGYNTPDEDITEAWREW